MLKPESLKIAVYSHSSSPKQGGGVNYLFSLSASLLNNNTRVTSFVKKEFSQEDFIKYMPDWGALIEFEVFNPSANLPLLGEMQDAIKDLKFDISVIQSLRVPRFNLSKHSYILCDFPFQKSLKFKDKLRLKSYKNIIVNSEFTAKWVKKFWDRESIVLHPPVEKITPLKKKKIILSVGRFLDGGRSKRQLEQVFQFRKMVEAGLKDWELHLAGYVQNTPYFEKVKEAAKGLPVFFSINLNRNTLENLYGEASIYWHFVGFDIDENKYPGAMEHYGISVVEAMTAGCVPVSINKGGPKEIIGDFDAGLLWETPEECIKQTMELIQDNDKLERMSENAKKRSEYFSFENFKRKARKLILDIQ